MELLSQQFRVPEIYGNYWFNSDPVPLNALRGYVILINFWDYSCLKCLRIFPYLREWNKRYNEKGLITIGIHTPQFPFARDPVNVLREINKHNINYPVVMDNDYFVWNAFRCNSWPTKFLIDKYGFIRFIQAGEGQYQNFENAIQWLVRDSGYHDELPFVMDAVRESDRPGAICYRETPEILTGWQRGTIGNVEGYAPESTVHYDDPHLYVDGRLYLDGDWFNERNYLRLETENPNGGYLVFIYRANSVYAIIRSVGEKGFQVFVQQDDKHLPRNAKGTDILYDEEGRSYFIVDDARLYNIVNNKEFGEHKLKMSTRSNGFAIYSIVFVSSVIPDSVAKC